MPSREQCQSSDNLNCLFYLPQTLLPQKTGLQCTYIRQNMYIYWREIDKNNIHATTLRSIHVKIWTLH